METKILTVGLVIVMCFCLFSACSDGGSNDNPGGTADDNDDGFNAELYSYAKEWVDDDFLKENRVPAYYPNENYVEGSEEEKYIHEKDHPKTLTFIITDEDKYNEIFTKSEIDVDFGKEMVVLYIFADVDPCGYEIKDINISSTVLTVKMQSTHYLTAGNANDASMPYQRCLMLKMNKVDVSGVVFEEARR